MTSTRSLAKPILCYSSPESETPITPRARAEFLAVINYIIRQDRPEAARRFRTRAEEILRSLEKFSESGRRIPEFPELPQREVLVTPYRFFYRVLGPRLDRGGLVRSSTPGKPAT